MLLKILAVALLFFHLNAFGQAGVFWSYKYPEIKHETVGRVLVRADIYRPEYSLQGERKDQYLCGDFKDDIQYLLPIKFSDCMSTKALSKEVSLDEAVRSATGTICEKMKQNKKFQQHDDWIIFFDVYYKSYSLWAFSFVEEYPHRKLRSSCGRAGNLGK
jgi:hypothetical protein